MEYLPILYAHAFYNFVACFMGSCAPLTFPYVPL
ncbi:MAG: hypothetical protein [Arizlama microvirus]|nr:MAG: hypothetical protein [Arizlama microvirus]